MPWLEKDPSKSLLQTLFAISNGMSSDNPDYMQLCKVVALENCQDGKWSPFVCMLALCNVLNLKISSFCPENSDPQISHLPFDIFNTSISPRNCKHSESINLFWCNQERTSIDVCQICLPDHVMPLFVITERTLHLGQIPKAPLSCRKQSKIPFPPLSMPLPHQSHACSFPSPELPAGHAKRELYLGNSTKEDSFSIISSEVAVTPSPVSEYDIGNFYETGFMLDAQKKYDVICNIWRPYETFLFPSKLVCGKNRKFNFSWLTLFPWLVYSCKLDGAFCLPCVLFGRRIGPNSSKLQRLLSSPYTDWSGAITRFKQHEERSEVHKTSLLTMNTFLNVMKEDIKPVNYICSKLIDDAVEKNKKKLLPILKTVILCARQNIPLRGHRDDSSYYGTADCGNFQALLDFRVDSGDKILEEHFRTAPKNATYRSKTTQNELICCSAEIVTNKIVDEIKQGRFFSILADEVADCSNKEQMPLVLRYVDPEGEIQERFVKFIHCDTGTSGKALATKIVNCITNELKLDVQNCRGQCYDGAGNMAGKYAGVAARIAEINSKALYTHCFSHRLNLCVASSCSIQKVKNAMEKMRQVANLFTYSTKKQLLLDEMVHSVMPGYKHTKLIDVCQTRWVLRIDGICRFLEMYPAVVAAVTVMSENVDNEWSNSASDAYGFLSLLRNFDFIITLVILKNCLGYTRSATIQLQGAHIDIIKGLSEINIMKRSLTTVRNLIDQYHNVWFEEASSIAENIGAAVCFPRIVSTQINRSNIPATNAVDYYKRNIAIPFLDHILNELSSRFSDEHLVAYNCISIVPAVMKQQYNTTGHKRQHNELTNLEVDVTKDHSSNAADLFTSSGRIKVQRIDKPWKRALFNFCKQYVNDMPNISSLSHEFDNWESAWRDCPAETAPDTLSKTMKLINPVSFPNIYTVLKILAVLPVTSCTCERSASTIRILKTYLRSNMSQDRLNGLGIIHSQRDIKIDLDSVIKLYSRKHQRKLKLNNILNSDTAFHEDDESATSEQY